MLFRLPKYVYNQTAGRLLGKRTQDAEVADLIDTEQTSEDQDTLQAAIPANANAETRKRKAKAKR